MQPKDLYTLYPYGSFVGIGVGFVISSDTITARNRMHDGPSEKIGLLPNDKIIYINDTLVAGKGISYDNVMKCFGD